ncbi:MAG: QueT transporter family protein, partial [Firmicutes bacterium]|nr:QueT transporter family protein [Bacillota bacterium]
GAVVLDIVFGSLATLIGAWGGWLLRKNRWLVPIPTIISNTLIIPLVLRYGYGIDIPLYLQMIYIAAGEILGCYVLGELLGSVLLRNRGALGGLD